MKPKVLIVMGSDSDMPVMEETGKILNEFGITYEMTIASAHRSPQRAAKLASGAEKQGIDVIIAGAGAAAHLAGVIAAHTILPVIGVPINSSPLQGLDALFSTVQMPPEFLLLQWQLERPVQKMQLFLQQRLLEGRMQGL